MEKLIKKVLKEYIEKSIEELMPSVHYEKNINVRFRGPVEYTVRKFSRTRGKLEMRDVGTYALSKREKSEAESRIDEVMKVDVPENLVFGIEIYRFNIDIDRINFFSKDDRYETLRDTLREDNPASVYLVDPQTESVGDILFFIIKENKVITTFLERSFNYESVKEKRSLDFLIKADEIKNYSVPKKEKPFNFNDWRRS